MVIFVPKEQHAKVVATLSSMNITPTWSRVSGCLNHYAIPDRELTHLEEYLLQDGLNCKFYDEEELNLSPLKRYNAKDIQLNLE